MKQLNKLFSAFSLKTLMPLSMFALLPTLANAQSTNIVFDDDKVKQLCVVNWDTNGDGELSKDEAAAVIDLGEVFKSNSAITSFNELQFFVGLKTIGDLAFKECRNLSSIIIPKGVISIGKEAFRFCMNLSSVSLPNSLVDIGEGAFHSCAVLASITIPNSVTTIGSVAFTYSGLTSVTIPKSVTSIGEWAFAGCNGLYTNVGLETIVVEEGNTKYDSRDNCNAIIETKSNSLIAGSNNATIPYGITAIKRRAFEKCYGLTQIDIPNSVKKIYNSAFLDCENLSSLTLPNSLAEIEKGAFNGCEGIETIVVDDGNKKYDSRDNCNAIIETATNTLLQGCKNTVIPNSITSIGESAFNGCHNLTSIIIPNSVTIIGDGAFNNCSGLTSVTIPNSVTSIGWGAFYFCKGLTSVTIGNSVSSIGENAFFECEGLTSITIPNSVKSIGDKAFSGCRGMTEVISLIVNPFAINTNVWQYVNTSSIPLYVPADTKALYEATEGWNIFNKIMGTGSSIPINKNTFPDENFRNWVLAQDYGQDGVLTEEEISGVTEIDVSEKNIADLKGIEYFTALTDLMCGWNKLTSLDVSKNTELKWLDCAGNQLTSLDVLKNTALTHLLCFMNQLTTLDVSKNTALIQLGCYKNQLTSLDVSQNTALLWLHCTDNHLTTLDVSKNTALTELSCSGNQLTALDVSKNTSLKSLHCSSNQINETEMGNLVESLPICYGAFYVKRLNDAGEQNVISSTQVAAAKAKGWKVYAWNGETWVEYDGDEPQEITPVEQGETIDIGTEIDVNTDLDGNVVGDIYYCISSDSGSYDPEEGCLVVTKPTEDSAIEGKDIFGEDFKDNYAGFMFMVAPGKGTIKVEAQTIGNMVLKVKVGDNAPAQKEVNGRTKVSFSYDVSEPTMVFIYGSIGAAGAKGIRKAAGTDALMIYGIEVSSETNGIEAIDNGQLTIDNSPVYNLNGQRVISSPSGRPGGIPTKGIYIQNGKKVLVK